MTAGHSFRLAYGLIALCINAPCLTIYMFFDCQEKTIAVGGALDGEDTSAGSGKYKTSSGALKGSTISLWKRLLPLSETAGVWVEAMQIEQSTWDALSL